MGIILAKTRFLKWFNKTPEPARKELIFDAFGHKPMTLYVIVMEVKEDTKLGGEILEALGFFDN